MENKLETLQQTLNNIHNELQLHSVRLTALERNMNNPAPNQSKDTVSWDLVAFATLFPFVVYGCLDTIRALSK